MQQIIDSGADNVLTLKKLSSLQRKIRRAGFQDFFASRMALQLDEIGLQIYEGKGLEGQFVRDVPNQIERGLQLLRLVMEGAFSEPEVTNRLRAFAKSSIMSVDFMAALKEQAGGGAGNASVLKEFTELLQRTRIDR